MADQAPARYTNNELAILMDTGFKALGDQVQTLIARIDDVSRTVVHREVYEAQHDETQRRLTAVEGALDGKAGNDDLADVRSLALWAIGLLAAAVLGGIFYAVLTVAK